MSDRLHEMFARLRAEGRGGLSIYLTVGFPDLKASEEAMDGALAAGADWLEVGIPFSDPAADGPVIQEASSHALANGIRVKNALEVGAHLRARHPDKPLVAMTYANIAFRRGWERFAQDLAKYGFDGLILPDVPLEESEPVREALRKHGVAWIPLVTPTTGAKRMGKIAETATGFLYVVANVGITGQDDPGPLVEATVQRAREAGAKVPLAVGFGIQSPKHVRRVLEAGAAGAIVGSQAIRSLQDGGREGLVALVASLAMGAEGS